jgi:fucose permease
MASDALVFRRTALTWLLYSLIGLFAYVQSAAGPVMPLLRAELSLDYTLGAAHPSAFAIGMIVAGLWGAMLVQRTSRVAVLWGGLAGMCAGVLLFSLGRVPLLTISGMWVMGVCGTLVFNNVNSALADTHGAHRASALSEANLIASICVIGVAGCVGALQGIGIGWRAALWLVPLLALALWLWGRPLPLPTTAARTQSTSAPVDAPIATSVLSSLWWGHWALMVLCVSVEWCLAVWGPDYMKNVVGLPAEWAAVMSAVFSLGMIVARIISSRVVGRVPPRRQVLIAFGITAVGFPLLWWGQAVWINIVGLFICGAGIANFFPMILTQLSGMAADQADVVSARVSLGAGLSILVVPFVLGALADQVGLQRAFAVVPLLLLMGVAWWWWLGRGIASAKV